MVLFQAAAIGLIALIVTPGLFFYFDVTPKIALLLLGAAVTLAWPRGSGSWRSVPKFTLLVFAALVSLAVSTALSVNPALSLFGTNWRRFGVLTQAALLLFVWLLARGVAGRPDRIRTILRAIAASGAVTAIYGIAQYFGWDPVLPQAAYHIGEGIWTIVRPPSTLGYVSYFATWSVAVVFLSVAPASRETAALIRYGCYAVAGLNAVAMVLTGTRAAMLGFVAGAVVWGFGRGFRVPRRVLAVAAVLLVAGVAFYFSPPGWQLRSRTRWFREDPWGGARIDLWRDSAAMAVRRPLGYGPEVFTAEFPRFESQALARKYPDFLHESPHNIFLDAWVSQGIPGLLILAGFCWIGFVAAWRGKQPWLAAALAATVVSQMFTVFTMPTALVFYVTIALAVGLNSTGSADRTPRLEYAVRWAAALLLLYGAARLTSADRQLQLARDSVAAGDFSASAAAAHYAEYDRLRLPGTGSDLWYSRACAALAGTASAPIVQLQARAQAAAAADRATRTSEEPFNAWYNLSGVYAGRDDFANTEKCLRAAIAARPNWFKPHWTLAQVLQLEGRVDEAEGEAAIAADRDGGKHSEVALTLQQIRARRISKQRQP